MKKIFVDHQQVRGKNYNVIIDDFILSKTNKKKNLINSMWDEFPKLRKDFNSVTKLKREIYIFVYKNLEKHHNTKMGETYWSIILTPWIDHLVPRIYQIWKMISSIKKNCSAEIYELEDKNFIYNNFKEAKYPENLDFNRWIISKIITYQGNFKITKKKIAVEKNFGKSSKIENVKYHLVNFLSKFFPSNKIMIDNIQIGFLNYILLSFKLRQFPFIWIENNNYKLSPTNFDLRKKIFRINIDKKNLSNFIKKNIIYFIPKNYLENFNSINKAISKSYWPKKPNLILTSSSYWFSDFFKIWCAEQKAQHKSKYIITQHGGKFGTEKFISNLDTQLDLADTFVSWGWKNNKSNVLPFFSLKFSKLKKIDYLKNKKIIFCQNIYPNYFSHIDGNPFSLNEKIYKTKIANLIFENLNKNLRKNYIIRYLESLKKNCYYFNRFLNNKILKDNGKKKFSTIIYNARIFIHDKDSTTFLETLSYNIPTILILKKGYLNKLTDTAKKHYKILEKNKIVFTNISSASNFLNQNYHEIDKWWKKKQTQDARSNFCEIFAKTTDNPVEETLNLIKKLQ
jgi:putative transferase (TIGR04331 family)